MFLLSTLNGESVCRVFRGTTAASERATGGTYERQTAIRKFCKQLDLPLRRNAIF